MPVNNRITALPGGTGPIAGFGGARVRRSSIRITSAMLVSKNWLRRMNYRISPCPFCGPARSSSFRPDICAFLDCSFFMPFVKAVAFDQRDLKLSD
jgi:hypothetical protein